ncbi:MAG: hypothetical protein M5U34_28350 [Chloroflexi bacterium]|nr:hypothetical protein [Chloroflexota bacterium]
MVTALAFWSHFHLKQHWQTAVAYTFATLMLVTAVQQTSAHYPSYADLSRYTVRDAMQPLLAAAPPDSIILADWHWATPLWYLQEVEGVRPDVAVEFVYPRTADYGADWAARIQAELGNGRSVISTHYDEVAYAALPPAEPAGDAFLFRQQPRTTLPASFTPLNLVLGETVQILGYELNETARGHRRRNHPHPGLAATAATSSGHTRHSPLATRSLRPPRQP